MAMALTEEEELGGAEVKAEPVKKEEGFDIQNLISVFWIIIIAYSFGSSLIGIVTGRIKDKSGGEFTPYDFFDNIFDFSQWNLEYSLGFDPYKVADQVKNYFSASPPPSA